MLKKYKIILLKNGSPKKTLFSSNVKRTTYNKFQRFINSKKPLFVRKYVKRKFCQFELGLFSKEDGNVSIYKKDELGRNLLVDYLVPNYHLTNLSDYWVEELVYDHTSNNRISVDELILKYLPKKNFKQVFSLNNKLIIQDGDRFSVFSLKTVFDCIRLLELIKNLFIGYGRLDCLFVPDTSTVQRKQLYDLLEGYGFSRKFLYKQYTY